MPPSPILLPCPRRLDRTSGEYPLHTGCFIRLATDARDLMAAARSLQTAVKGETGLEWQITAGGPGTDVAVTLAVDRSIGHAEGYRLDVAPSGISIVGGDAAGGYYGAQTLAQLVRMSTTGVPCLTVEDWPDFAARGVMLDISRDKVPTMETLYALVDLLASWKINQIQLYTEHTFAYRSHAEVWAEASPMTGEEILALDGYCRERHAQLVPNQNSFGHMERWLKLPRYARLAEAPDGFEFPWGERHAGPFSLCPLDIGSRHLLEGLYDELLPHFSSTMFNVGCDETFDLGVGRSKDQCEARGTERVYLDFLLAIHRLVAERGRTMQFWGDIILHRPDLISELPKDAIALEWGYEADHPFARDCGLFAEAGIPFYVCPGTSSWNTIAGRTRNALGNLASAAENGRAAGAAGYLITDWGDNGHLQYLPISYLGFAAGAALSWCGEANRDLDVAEALSVHAFSDRAGVMGRLAYDLGNVYVTAGEPVHNASRLFHVLHQSAEGDAAKAIGIGGFDAAEAATGAAMAPLDRARMRRADAGLVADEFRNAAAMLRVACGIGRLRLGAGGAPAADVAAELRHVLGEHRRLWLARNRPGGLQNSPRALEARLRELDSQ